MKIKGIIQKICSTTKSKTDEIWCVRVSPSQLYVTIRLLPKTRMYLSEK